MRIGLVSDTHGLTDPKLPGLFQGCAQVLHAGDIVTSPVLATLSKVAPVIAVRGNNDIAPEFEQLPEAVCLPLGELRLLMLHDLGHRESPRPRARAALVRERPHIVIHGHSHHPGAATSAGRLFVNPGSAGPRRFTLPRTAAILTLDGRRAAVTFFELSGDRPLPHGDPFEAVL